MHGTLKGQVNVNADTQTDTLIVDIVCEAQRWLLLYYAMTANDDDVMEQVLRKKKLVQIQNDK